MLNHAFADQAREIRVFVRGAGALVDQAALFEFAEGQSNGGDGMTVLWFRNDVASQRA